MTGMLLSTVVPVLAVGALTLALLPRTPASDDGWQPGELEAVRAMPDRPLSGPVLPPRRPLPPLRPVVWTWPVLIVDRDLGVVELPTGIDAGTPIFDRLSALHRLRRMTGGAW